LGISSVLTKPITLHDLTMTVRNVLDEVKMPIS